MKKTKKQIIIGIIILVILFIIYFLIFWNREKSKDKIIFLQGEKIKFLEEKLNNKGNMNFLDKKENEDRNKNEIISLEDKKIKFSENKLNININKNNLSNLENDSGLSWKVLRDNNNEEYIWFNNKIEIKNNVISFDNNSENILDDEEKYLRKLFKEARNFSNKKEYKKAIGKYLEILEIDQTKFSVYHNLWVVYYNIKDYRKAIESYKKAIKLNNKDYKAYAYLWDTYADIKDYKKAIEFYKKSIKLNSNYSKVYNNLAIVYWKTHQYEKKIFYYIITETIKNKNINYNILTKSQKKIYDLEYKKIKKFVDEKKFNKLRDYAFKKYPDKINNNSDNNSKIWNSKNINFYDLAVEKTNEWKINEAIELYKKSITYLSIQNLTYNLPILAGAWNNMWFNYKTKKDEKAEIICFMISKALGAKFDQTVNATENQKNIISLEQETINEFVNNKQYDDLRKYIFNKYLWEKNKEYDIENNN